MFYSKKFLLKISTPIANCGWANRLFLAFLSVWSELYFCTSFHLFTILSLILENVTCIVEWTDQSLRVHRGVQTGSPATMTEWDLLFKLFGTKKKSLYREKPWRKCLKQYFWIRSIKYCIFSAYFFFSFFHYQPLGIKTESTVIVLWRP